MRFSSRTLGNVRRNVKRRTFFAARFGFHAGVATAKPSEAAASAIRRSYVTIAVRAGATSWAPSPFDSPWNHFVSLGQLGAFLCASVRADEFPGLVIEGTRGWHQRRGPQSDVAT